MPENNIFHNNLPPTPNVGRKPSILNSLSDPSPLSPIFDTLKQGFTHTKQPSLPTTTIPSVHKYNVDSRRSIKLSILISVMLLLLAILTSLLT